MSNNDDDTSYFEEGILMKVSLTEEQQALRQVIENNLAIARNHMQGSQSKVQEAISTMGEAAHKLHMQLEPKPKHHAYMIENSGMEPEDPEFYHHIHPVEDLLAYLDDTSANDDLPDETLGEEFEFAVYTRRWGHKDTYRLTRNEKGWHISFNAYDEQADTDGSPVLNETLKHDFVSFPHDINSYFNAIWQRAKNEGLSHSQVQGMLNTVAEWVSDLEENAPKDLLL
jgi:hypothetical protein